MDEQAKIIKIEDQAALGERIMAVGRFLCSQRAWMSLREST